MHWRITAAFCVGRTTDRGEYAITLETADGQRASATVDVWWTRWPTPCASRVFDPAVHVLHCSDARASEWLGAAEHEYLIAEQLHGGCRRAA
jgi:hypothetical protein